MIGKIIFVFSCIMLVPFVPTFLGNLIKLHKMKDDDPDMKGTAVTALALFAIVALLSSVVIARWVP